MEPDGRLPVNVKGQVDRMNALQASVEALWGMTMDEYAELCVSDPDEADRVAAQAQERLAACERTGDLCECGHKAVGHFAGRGQCLHETPTATWACSCREVHRPS